MKDPTKTLPNRLPRGEEPFVREFARWVGDVARAFPSWAACRVAAKSQALARGRHAGECRSCLANVTRPIGTHLDRCP